MIHSCCMLRYVVWCVSVLFWSLDLSKIPCVIEQLTMYDADIFYAGFLSSVITDRSVNV